MNASKLYLLAACGLIFLFSTSTIMAEQGLNASSQTKVNNAKAKMWTSSDNKNPIDSNKTVVNFGSRRGGDCSVNVGTVQPGQKAPKDIVVTTKNVINVCK